MQFVDRSPLTLIECSAMHRKLPRFALTRSCRTVLLVPMLSAMPGALRAQTPAPATPEIPEWALPGSATHKQVPPPADFHRPSRNFDTPIGMFQGQSDIGGALVPGSASYNADTRQYTINSAGYNIWYQRDEFRYLWKKMSGDFSIAADGSFPIAKTPEYDRKIVLIVRQDLEDDSKEIMTGKHATGMVHLAERPEKGRMIEDMQYRIGGTLLGGVKPKRIGLEKQGDAFALHEREGRADASVWSADLSPSGRPLLRRHRFLLALPRHGGYRGAHQRFTRERGRRGSITNRGAKA